MFVEKNVSTACDMANLCYHAMKNEKFREVVIEAYRETESIGIEDHVYKWKNTNFLLK